DNEHLLQLQVTVLTKLDQPELLIIKLKQLLSIKSETTANQVLLVNLLVFKKEFEEANTFSKSLLTKYPNNTQLLQLQATIDIQLGLFSDALKHSKQAIAYGDNTTSTQVIVGIAAYQQGRFDEANHHLKSVINEYADNDELLSILAHTYLKIGQSYQASKLVQLISYDNTNKNNLVNATSYELIKQGYTTQAKKLIESNENTLKNDNDKYLSSNIKLLLQDFSAIPELENQHDDTNSNETKKAALTSAYIANGDLQKAELYAKKWQQTSPHKIEPLLFLSLIAQKNNQYARARDFLQQALVIDNKNIDVIIALVNLNIKTDNLQDAKKQISKLVQENPTYLPALTTFFDVFRDSSLSKDAMLPILKFQKQQPKNISVTLLVAQMYFQLKEYDTSLQQIENLKVLTKYLPLAAKKIKGEALITIGQYEKAENHYKDWIKEQPYNKASILGLLNVYDSLNKFQQGILVLDNYLKEVSDPFLLSFKAYFLIQTGNREASKNILKELSKKERDKAFVKGIQARIYIAESKYNKALPLAKIAYENIPSQKNLISVVMSQEKLADHESAIKMLETHTSKYKNDIIALLILAERRLDKNTLQSQKLYQQVIVIEPKNIIALNNLANIYLQANQLNKAESLLHEVLAISPNYTASIDSLAQIRTLTGDHQAALLLLQKAYQLAPNDSTLLLNYISSMIDNNKIKLARRYLEKVKEKYPRLMKKSNEISERLEHL
ncbi:MAG: putative PEP-CTERM system TPR-repeat lipoprotein, partial [Alteromonadaceae bacterium]